jgi:hypothetical protein
LTVWIPMPPNLKWGKLFLPRDGYAMAEPS